MMIKNIFVVLWRLSRAFVNMLVVLMIIISGMIQEGLLDYEPLDTKIWIWWGIQWIVMNAIELRWSDE